MLKGKEGNMYF